MKWRGLICGPESVRAYLASTKIQTRRVVKPQPFNKSNQSDTAYPSWAWKEQYGVGGMKLWALKNLLRNSCPYGVPGDGLYVREAFCPCACDACLAAWPKQGPHGVLGYKADGNCWYTMKPGRYMPRWAARIFLELVEVRVERVNDWVWVLTTKETEQRP